MPFGDRNRERNAEILRMHFAGASRFEIAVRFRISHGWAHDICRILKGNGNGKSAPEKTERNNEIKRMYRLGQSISVIASKYRIAEITVRDILRHEKPYNGPMWRDIQERRLH